MFWGKRGDCKASPPYSLQFEKYTENKMPTRQKQMLKIKFSLSGNPLIQSQYIADGEKSHWFVVRLNSTVFIPPSLFHRLYSTVSMESTMLIFAMERRGTAVASRQAAMETAEASAMAAIGTATGCSVSVFAAPTKIQQT